MRGKRVEYCKCNGLLSVVFQKYKQTKLVKMCKAKRIPIIPKKDVIVTRNVALGHNPVTGYVCEAQWTKPDGSKVGFIH